MKRISGINFRDEKEKIAYDKLTEIFGPSFKANWSSRWSSFIDLMNLREVDKGLIYCKSRKIGSPNYIPAPVDFFLGSKNGS